MSRTQFTTSLSDNKINKNLSNPLFIGFELLLLGSIKHKRKN